MDFTYTEEQEMVRELAATFAKNYVAPLSEQMDIDNTMPHHIAEKMAELGFMGINVLRNTAVPEWTKSAKHLLSWKLPK